MVYQFPSASEIHIRTISSPVHGVTAVAIEPPYREFPNVILFNYDEGAKRWKRVFEGLTIGIQPEVSRFLDLHTVGLGVDIKQLPKPEQQKYLSDSGLGHGWVSIPYLQFVHMHPSGPESYYIDKRDFSRFGKRLFPRIKASNFDNECTVFDLPDLAEISLSHDSGRFKLTARTVNDQQWEVTFTGINGSGYLDHKIVLVRQIGSEGDD